MALRGASMLAARLAPKVLKILGKTAGSAIAGTAVDRVAKKIFGGGRARRRLRRMLHQRRRRRTRGRGRRRHRRRQHRHRGRRRVRGRGLFTSLLGPSVIRSLGGKPVRKKHSHNPVHRLKSWAKSKAKSWIAGKVRKHLGIGGGRGRASGRGLRLFSAPGLVRRQPINFQTAARKRRAGTTSTSHGGCRYHRRRHHRRRR